MHLTLLTTKHETQKKVLRCSYRRDHDMTVHSLVMNISSRFLFKKKKSNEKSYAAV